jgi:hypothetical protein
MSRPPQYDISLDLLSRQASLEDYTAGDASIVRTIEARQHALVCGWGTPPQVVTLFHSTIDITYNQPMLIRVPPYCTRMRVASLRWGTVAYGIQVGAFPSTITWAGTDALEPALAQWNEGGTEPGTVGSETESLQVLSSAVGTWSTAIAFVTILPLNGQILALGFYPVLEQAV